MTVDVKLGVSQINQTYLKLCVFQCLTISLEENYWNKAIVPVDMTDLDLMLHGKKSTDTDKINLGMELMKKLLISYRKELVIQQD